MQRAFAIAGGLVDLDARAIARCGRVSRLARGETRILEHLHAWQRRIVPVAEIARATGVGADDVGDLLAALHLLERRLGAVDGHRPVLRRRGRDGVGLWPEPQAPTPAGACLLVAVGLDARNAAYLDDPSATDALWSAERDRWLRAGASVGAFPVEEGEGAFVLRVPGSAQALPWVRKTLAAAPGGVGLRLRVAGDRLVWFDGLAVPALDRAVDRLSRLWERAPRGAIVVTDAARRACDDGGPLALTGELRLDPVLAPSPVWVVGGAAALQPAAVEPILPSVGWTARDVDLVDAALGAIGTAARLVVLHGPPGCGKTDLALRLAHIVHRRLRGRGGARFVRMGDREGDLADQVAAELGLLGVGDPSGEVARALRHLGDGALVIDGFERGGSAALDHVQRWREGAPRLTILLTSREELRLSGAFHVRVQPPTPAAGGRALLELLASNGTTLAEPSDADARAAALAESVGAYPLSLGVAAGLVAELGLDGAARACAPLLDLPASERQAAVIGLARGRLPAPHRRALDRLGGLTGDFDVSTARVLIGDDPPADVVLSALIDRGLLRARPDPVLGELRLSVPGPVGAALEDHLPRAERQRLRAAVRLHLVGRARAWVAALESGGDERAALRRLALAAPELLYSLGHIPAGEERDALLLGLLRVSALGRVALPTLADAALLDPTSPAAALVAARGRLLAGELDDAVALASRAEAGPSPIRDAAILVGALAARGTWSDADARAALVGLLRTWLESPDPRRLPAAGPMLDALCGSQLVGDARDLADSLTAVAESSGATWRRDVIAVHRFRALAMLGRAGPDDRVGLVTAVDGLQEVGDHRTASLGLQWLARHAVATGDPAGGLGVLDRVAGYLDVYGSPAVRQLLALDRARAASLVGDSHTARRALAEVERAYRSEDRLPLVVRAVDCALVALLSGEPGAALAELQRGDLRDPPEPYRTIIGLLGHVARVECGAPSDPPIVVRRGAVGVLVAAGELAAAWGDRAALGRVAAAVAARPDARALGMHGVLVRALLELARRRA